MKNTQNIRLSVDAVVFGYDPSNGLSVLLINRAIAPFKDMWALPGGLVKNEESLEQAVERELLEETGVSINYLEQLYSFGNPKRDPRNRVVSVAYFGLVRPQGFSLMADTDARDAGWFNLESLPELAFDHVQIVKKAHQRLQAKIRYEPIGFELLDKQFPFSALEKLYSTVIGSPIDRRNFKKKIMKFGFLIETSIKQKHRGSGRPGNLFKFDEKKYYRLVKEGINFEI